MMIRSVALLSLLVLQVFTEETCKTGDEACELPVECTESPDSVLTDFEPCQVDPHFTDYSSYDLTGYIATWQHTMANDNVESITKDCAEGTVQGCQRGSINWTGKKVIIDTDLENEVDDYLAVVWALLSSIGSSKQIDIISIIAAPFSFRYRFLPLVEAQLLFQKDQKHHKCKDSPALSETEQLFLYGPPGSPGGKMSSLIRLKDVGLTPKLMIERENHATWCPDVGMDQSYKGLLRLVDLFSSAVEAGVAPVFADIASTPVYKGQTKYVTGQNPRTIVASEGVAEIIRQARAASPQEPVYIVSIGAPTNVATALMVDPTIVSKIVLLWDATWGLENRERVVTGSLNFGEDLVASRVVHESNVRMLYFPGFPSGQTLQLSQPEVEAWFRGQGVVSDAIYKRYVNNPDTQFSGLGFGRYRNAGTTRIMWDIGNFLPFILPGLLSVQAIAAPRLHRVKTVPGTCEGYASIGTTCKAWYPSSLQESNEEGDKKRYLCHEIDPYDLTRCNDGFFIDWLDEGNGTAPLNLIQAMMLGGLSGPGGSGIDLLHKLQAAGL